jgi:hypothetical protein
MCNQHTQCSMWKLMWGGWPSRGKKIKYSYTCGLCEQALLPSTCVSNTLCIFLAFSFIHRFAGSCMLTFKHARWRVHTVKHARASERTFTSCCSPAIHGQARPQQGGGFLFNRGVGFFRAAGGSIPLCPCMHGALLSLCFPSFRVHSCRPVPALVAPSARAQLAQKWLGSPGCTRGSVPSVVLLLNDVYVMRHCSAKWHWILMALFFP